MWGRQVNSSTTAKTAQNQGRLSDLEDYIRSVYRQLITAHEQTLMTTSRPEEKLEAERRLQENWEKIYNYAKEYIPLCKKMKHEIPQDINEYIWAAEQRFGQIEQTHIVISTDYATRLVEEWIKRVSFSLPVPLEHNPCASQVYEKEDDLLGDKYIVWHPAYDAVWTQQSTILFADVGCGKSACRLSAKHHFQANDIFVIEYSGWEDFVWAVSQSYAQSAHLGLANLVDLASDLRCTSVCIMIDNINKNLADQKSDIVSDLLITFFQTCDTLIRESKLIFKAFLPRVFKEQFAGWTYPDSICQIVELCWSFEQLSDMLSRRLGASNSQENVSLKLLMDTHSRWQMTDMAQVLDDPNSALVKLASGSPRRLLEMVNFLFQCRAIEWHTRGRQEENIRIQPTDWGQLLEWLNQEQVAARNLQG